MLRNIISLKEQLLARVSFILDPASKFKDPGQMIEEFDRHWGVCAGAEESDRLLGVLPIYQPFSSAGAERASEHSPAEPIRGAGGPAAAGPTWGIRGTWTLCASLMQELCQANLLG